MMHVSTARPLTFHATAPATWPTSACMCIARHTVLVCYARRACPRPTAMAGISDSVRRLAAYVTCFVCGLGAGVTLVDHSSTSAAASSVLCQPPNAIDVPCPPLIHAAPLDIPAASSPPRRLLDSGSADSDMNKLSQILGLTPHVLAEVAAELKGLQPDTVAKLAELPPLEILGKCNGCPPPMSQPSFLQELMVRVHRILCILDKLPLSQLVSSAIANSARCLTRLRSRGALLCSSTASSRIASPKALGAWDGMTQGM